MKSKLQEVSNALKFASLSALLASLLSSLLATLLALFASHLLSKLNKAAAFLGARGVAELKVLADDAVLA